MATTLQTEDYQDRRITSEPEAAKYCCLSLVHFRRLRRESQGPQYVQFTERRISYCMRDLIEWINQRLCN